MKITGIIAEYDPLHAGHIYQMQVARKQTECDYLICVMDGAFTQRGEGALMDKYARVRMALAAGADAVIELPQVYAVRPAQIFARGGIDILRAAGADAVCFGCETDDREMIMNTARLLLDEPESLKQAIKQNLSLGMAYPRALGEALENPYIDRPNFTLGLEYAKRIIETGSGMEIHAVKRTDDYHAGGATRVRALIRAGSISEAEENLPDEVRQHYEYGERLFDMSRLDALFLYSLRGLTPGKRYPDDAEGLLERIIKLSRESVSTEQLTENVKCKRYTRARIARLITNAVIDLPEAPAEIPYLRLLGAKKSAAPLLGEIDRRSGGMLISSAAKLKGDPCFDAECRTTDIWGLGTGYAPYRRSGREFTQKFIML